PGQGAGGGRLPPGPAGAETWGGAVGRVAVDPPSEAERQAWARAPYLVRMDEARAELEVAIALYDIEHNVPAALSATICLAFLRDQERPSIEEHLARELLRTANAVRNSLVDD